jgi:hypothetical protein
MGKENMYPDLPSGSLKDLIELKFRESRATPPLGPDSSIRASGFASLCPREEVLAALHNIFREESFEADLLLVFAVGTGLHRMLQDEILPKIGAMVGEWVCLECSKHYGGMQGEPGFDLSKMVPKPDKCTKRKCGSVEFRYQEQFFRDEQFRITGHPDGFINVPGREGTGVLEAKSISTRGAMEIRRIPKWEHVIQAQIYMWMTGLPWACLLYWDKGTFGMNGLVEHFVDRDEDTIVAIKEGLKSIWEGIENNSLPPRICANNTCERASGCPAKVPCFATET